MQEFALRLVWMRLARRLLTFMSMGILTNRPSNTSGGLTLVQGVTRLVMTKINARNLLLRPSCHLSPPKNTWVKKGRKKEAGDRKQKEKPPAEDTTTFLYSIKCCSVCPPLPLFMQPLWYPVPAPEDDTSTGADAAAAIERRSKVPRTERSSIGY